MKKDFDTQNEAYVLGLFATGLAAVRSLGREGIPVKAFDSIPKLPGFRSRYCKGEVCPDAVHEPDLLVNFLKDQVRQSSRKVVLIPTSDVAFLFISRHRAQLAEKFLFNLPSEEVAEDVINKRRLYELAGKTKTPYPETFFPTDHDEAVRIKDAVGYPAFIKPYFGYQWREYFGGSHKGFKVHSPQELLDRFQEVFCSGHPALVQSYITSPDDNLFSLSLYVDQEGKVLTAFARRQIRQYPPNSGTVTLAVSEHNAALVADGIHFCQAIGYRGIVGLEYKLDQRDNQFKLLDFNPRLMLSDMLTAYCGINLALMQYLDLTCQKPTANFKYPDGVKWLDSIADFRAFKRYHEDGELGLWEWLTSIMGSSVFALFALDDPLPFLVDRKFGLSYARILEYMIRQIIPNKRSWRTRKTRCLRS